MEAYGQFALSVDFILCWVVLTQHVFASYWVAGSTNCWMVKSLILPYLLVEGYRELLWDVSSWANWYVQRKKGSEKNNTHFPCHEIWIQAFICVSFSLPNIFSWHIFHCHLKILLCNNQSHIKNKQDNKNILRKSIWWIKQNEAVLTHCLHLTVQSHCWVPQHAPWVEVTKCTDCLAGHPLHRGLSFEGLQVWPSNTAFFL